MNNYHPEHRFSNSPSSRQQQLDDLQSGKIHPYLIYKTYKKKVIKSTSANISQSLNSTNRELVQKIIKLSKVKSPTSGNILYNSLSMENCQTKRPEATNTFGHTNKSIKNPPKIINQDFSLKKTKTEHSHGHRHKRIPPTVVISNLRSSIYKKNSQSVIFDKDQLQNRKMCKKRSGFVDQDDIHKGSNDNDNKVNNLRIIKDN